MQLPGRHSTRVGWADARIERVFEVLTDVMFVANGNKKTGNMPTTSRPESTCPTTCPFLKNGCYGTGRHWGTVNKLSTDTKVSKDQALAKLAPAVRKGAKYLRDRVLGDVVASDGSFDREYLLGVADIASTAGLIPYGYSHHWRAMSADDVAAVAESGYRLNASCESVSDVADALSMGLSAVIVNDDIPEGTMIDGRRVVTCPEQTRGVKCADCGLCMGGANRKAVIRFVTHGAATRAARAAVAARNA